MAFGQSGYASFGNVKLCEMSQIEGDSIYEIHEIIESWSVSSVVNRKLHKEFLNKVKFDKADINYPPSRLHVSFVISKEGSILNFCSSVEISNQNEILAFFESWYEENIEKADENIRVRVLFTCIKWG